MFRFFKKGQNVSDNNYAVLTLKISGMHCNSCAMNIDGALEDTPGVMSANTHFARGIVEIQYDATKVQQQQLLEVIQNQGYEVFRQ